MSMYVFSTSIVLASTPYELDDPYAYELFRVGTIDDYTTVSINNDYDKNIFITMEIIDKSIDSIVIFVNGQRSGTIPINKNARDYWINIELDSIDGNEAHIALAKQRGSILSFSGAGVIEFGIKKSGSRWVLDVNKNAVIQNQKMFNNLPEPSSAMGEVSTKIADISNSIVGGETDPRKILRLVYDWVCENIYYDRVSTDESLNPEDILEHKRARCQGYSLLTQALLRAQNIPCTCAAGYIYDVAAVGGPEDLFTGPIPVDGMSDITGYPHVWNEAYVDGEWVTLDTTWDSLNIYNGEYIKSEYPPAHCYYDSSLIYFSQTHVITGRDTEKIQAKDTPSSWAIDEVNKAIELGIIPSYMQNNYKKGITRKEFASLAVAAIKKDMGSILFKLDLDTNLKYNPNIFSDTTDPDVIMAYLCNIVTGKGNGIFAPDDMITRQEAAVMLHNTAKVIRDYDGWSIRKSTYSDKDNIAEWAKEGVDFVTSAVDRETGKSIMGGVGNNTFQPNGIYSREQAFITFGRLFNMTFGEN